MLSVGAGIQYNMATVTIKRFSGLQPFTGEAHFRFEGSDNGAIGFNAGILFKPLDNLSFGLSYRSEVEYNFEGTAEADGPSAIQSSLPAGDITSSLTTPQQIVFGAAYTVIPELTITADFQYVFWESYDTLAIDFTDPQYDDIANPRLYDNNFFVRLGAEYRYDEDWTFRGGVYYDKNPIKDEYLDATLPDADRFGFTLGAGYAVTEQMTVDAAYLFLRFNERTVDNSEINGSGNGGFVPFNGTYNNIANILSLTITYNF
jgi:long-chain fatty acid transport protein